ncbi:MAG: cellulose synthase (UDP-forming) [Myxococcota bacterium]|jgi:cellulose synthase (UDP-forming)
MNPNNQDTAEDAPRAYPGPIQSRLVRHALSLLLAGVTAGYFIWRIGATMPSDGIGVALYGLLFLGAELLLACLSFSFFVHLSGGTRRGPPPPPLANAKVDVLIATYNEDVSLVRRTAVAARDMEYPCNVWICDDGRRPEIRELSLELGVGYRIRPDNSHFKAGNLNAALRDAEAEFLLILDADHVPRRELISRTIGYFRDPSVAFVQTPQVYHNVESFQHALDLKRGWLYHENSLFQHDIQAGSERHQAAFFVGTGAIFRRSALEEVGGIATHSITEDILTALQLHARGYRSVFVDEALAFLTAPETPLAFAQQRMRWAQGAMQILRRDNPLLKAGLSPWQRIAYFNALAGWLAGPATLVMWAAPAIYLLTGLSPIDTSAELALPVIATKVIVDLGVYLLLCYPQGRLLLSDCFRMMVAPLSTFALLTLIKPDGLQFKVTPKGSQAGLPRSIVVPLLLSVLVNSAAVAVGLGGLSSAFGATLGLRWLLIGFCLYFVVSTGYALLFAFEREASDGEYTLPVDLPAELPGSSDITARAGRLSLSTAWLRASASLPAGAPVILSVPCLDGGALRMRGAVISCAPSDGSWVARVQLDPIDPDDADRLDGFLFEVALPTFLGSFRHGPYIHDATPLLPPGTTSHAGLLSLETSLL